MFNMLKGKTHGRRQRAEEKKKRIISMTSFRGEHTVRSGAILLR